MTPMFKVDVVLGRFVNLYKYCDYFNSFNSDSNDSQKDLNASTIKKEKKRVCMYVCVCARVGVWVSVCV